MTPACQPHPSNGHLLYILDDGTWSHGGPIFAIIADAHAEIKAMVDIVPSMKGTKYSIVPNDGICQGAYRPLDCGDRIYAGKPKGNLCEVFVA